MDARVVAVGGVDVQIVRFHFHTTTRVSSGTLFTTSRLVHNDLVKVKVAIANR